MPEDRSAYDALLETFGYLRMGRPAEGVLRSPSLIQARDGLTDASLVDRSFRYEAVLDEHRLGVTDIFELDGSACIYFKQITADPSPDLLRRWHRTAWNHGLARMLWVCTPTTVRIFNTFAPPPADRVSLRSNDVLLFEGVADDLKRLGDVAPSRLAIQTGRFWSGRMGRRIDRATRVDEQLIADLAVAASELAKTGLDPLSAHRLLLRTLFVAYLEARRILPTSLFRALKVERFEQVLSSVESTKRFFGQLRTVVNGDLFPPPPNDVEFRSLEGRLHDKHLDVLRRILKRTDLKTGQQVLGFARYDFDTIPIELISSIYEKFIYASDTTAARERGTHYTPVNLVTFALDQIFDDDHFGAPLPADAKALDPACGSGVFLVEILRRLVSKRIAAGQEYSRALVRDTLYRQVFGLDVSETAVEIAAFSLCLTAFELDPRDEPGSVEFERPLKGTNLFVADAFDQGGSFLSQAPFKERQFSLLVGNPPWTRHKGKRSFQGNPVPSHLAYCRERTPPIPLPYRDPADQAFVWRAADFGSESARMAFFLEGKRFFSHQPDSINSKAALLRRFCPRILVNLAGLHREQVFPSSQQPAVLLVAANREAASDEAFHYLIVERDLRFRVHGVMRIGPENIKPMSLAVAVDEDGLKAATWGDPRDFELIMRLRSRFDSVRTLLKERDLELSQGFIKATRERVARPDGRTRLKPAPPELLGKPMLERRALTPVRLDVTRISDVFRYEKLEHARDPEIYRPPLLVTASRLRGNRVVAAMASEEVIYSRSYYGIAGGRMDAEFLNYLCAILNSSIATYFIFLTATNWGVEKYEILPTDIERLPVPRPEAIDSEVRAALLEAANGLARSTARTADQAQAKLDEVVADLFDLSRTEKILIADMVKTTIDYQRRHDKSGALQRASATDCSVYAEAVAACVNSYLRANERRASVARVIVGESLAAVKVSLLKEGDGDIELLESTDRDLGMALERVSSSLDIEISEGFVSRRHLRLYQDDSFYILKPTAKRFWTQSAAFADGDAIIGDLLVMCHG